MTSHDRAAFAQLMVGLGETFNEPVSPARLEIYFASLSDLDLGAIRGAATAHVKTSRFFPRPAELRELVTGRLDDKADLAWTSVVRLVRRYGYPGVDGRGKPPDFPDEASRRAALELYGGWRALCEKLPGEGPELLGVVKLFKSLYSSYTRSGHYALPPAAAEARAQLGALKAELEKRGLPSGTL